MCYGGMIKDNKDEGEERREEKMRDEMTGEEITGKEKIGGPTVITNMRPPFKQTIFK